MMTAGLSGKTALVTGAGKGLGRALVGGLVEAGIGKVVAITRSQEDLDSLVKEYGSEKILPVQGDLGKENAGAVLDEALAQVDDLHFLVNNAGMSIPQSLMDVTEEAWTEVMKVNSFAPLLCTQKAVKKMLATGDAEAVKQKSIVNISSQASLFALEDHTSYSMSKGALDLLTKTAALELGPHKIRCNAVNPTVIMTPMGRRVWGDPAKGGPMLTRIPLEQFAEESDVVKPVLFLLDTTQSGMINGATLPIEGGMVAVCKMK
ncbi:unnamed protein product [Amoebophrya sp. A120]|nr:unnamed protein product [Amoebophrya sp. A120]|eukprot:GSA120T00022992001.1